MAHRPAFLRVCRAVAVALLLAPALAAAQQSARSGTPAGLRGPVSPEQPPPAVPAATAGPVLPGDDTLSAALDPDLSGPSRVGGWSAPSGGGGQCRMSCAQDRYFCRTTQDQQDCDSAWSQCVVACPARTDSPL